jgi:pimeloyl-ACP methyl ester carboxylesterase
VSWSRHDHATSRIGPALARVTSVVPSATCTGHLPWLEAPEEFCTALLGFLT